MTRFSHDDDDDKLINFLSQYRPVPPPASPQLEEELIKRIKQEPMASKYSYHWFWVLPGAMAATLLMIWGGDRWLRPSPQIAGNPEELETFLMDSWTLATEDTSYTSEINNSNIYWLTFADSQLETNPSYSLTY